MNLGELRAFFKGNINRSDITDALADFYIQSSLSRLGRRLRLPFQEVDAELTVDANGYAQVPQNFLEHIDIAKKPDGVSLTLVSLVDFRTTSDTTVYCRVRDKFRFKGTKAGDKIDLIYYEDFLPVSADEDINQIMSLAPDVIMLGACADASIYFVDDRQQSFESLFADRVQELEDQSQTSTLRGGVFLGTDFIS